ncbi:MAG: GNAT family protein [Rhodococcus sp. (in: high G+C Gram-positive bacteria)]|uniref:GNAT family N-acetyltransferase n=1 Tax=Rhodococcus sp. TaxID=1831 RepID=UPI002ADC218B|nr:GNAT family protein [Rhodococcus sp. (in: high G+C Gram-positive bacteria)]
MDWEDAGMTPTTAPVTIRTDRLVLRTYRPGDHQDLLAFYGRSDVCRYLFNAPWSPEDAREAVQTRISRRDLAAGALALVVEYDGQVVGSVSAWLVDEPERTAETERTAELGWAFSPEFGGRGFATEAVTALLGYVFATPRLHRVIAQMDARNESSARLAQRIGMRREGHFRQNAWIKNEWTDTLVFATLRSEWPSAA